MIIALDIGNSSINIGYFTNIGLIVQKIDTFPLKKVDEYKLILSNFLSKNHIEKTCFEVIISSVVFSHTAIFKDVLNRLTNKAVDRDILVLNYKINTGLKFKVDFPEKLGTDRIANAAGACEIYNPPVAVIDFGTATTISVVDQFSNFIGGSIMPGLGLMNNMLDNGTSGLKKIDIELPESALGTDSSGCIRSGIFYGTAGAVERILDEIEKETGCKFKVVVTGGYGCMMDKFIKLPHEINPNLTLKGLKIIYEKNKSA